MFVSMSDIINMKIWLVCCLSLLAVGVRINLMTSVIINEVPFSQDLICNDCADPVLYKAVHLPPFATIQGNTLKVDGNPQPGQYHINIIMTDSVGQQAHILFVVVVLDPVLNSSLPRKQTPQLIVELNNGLTKNELGQVETPTGLTGEEEQMQEILSRQAQLNQKIANHLILVRRLTNLKSNTQNRASSIASDLQTLLPRDTQLTKQILEHQNQLLKDKQAIRELLQFIRDTRKEIIANKDKSLTEQTVINQLIENLQELLVQNQNIQITIKFRQDVLANLSQSIENSTNCDDEALEKETQLLANFQKEESSLKESLTQKDEDIEKQRARIAELQAQLKQSQEKEKQLVDERGSLYSELVVVLEGKNSSVTLLSSLKESCESTSGNNQERIEEMKEQILILQDSLDEVIEDRSSVSKQISEKRTVILGIRDDINFLNAQIDDAINSLQSLYDDVEENEQKMGELTAQRERIKEKMGQLEDSLASLESEGEGAGDQLQEAKQMLSDLLAMKKQTDEEVRKIMLNNLDIIKSLRGIGQYTFDLEYIANITGSVIDMNLWQIYELNVDGQPGDCLSGTTYYGVGEIESVEDGVIVMKGAQGAALDLKLWECSILMSTEQSHTVSPGDVICWKGFKSQQEWVIQEAIIFPQQP